jgi:glycine/sarcosine N-methyltransferase
MMYDILGADYDRFVDWPGRLAAELPFIEATLKEQGAHHVLDVACGTGMHAIALADRGYGVVGADVSEGMIERARANAATAGVTVRFETAGFGELGERVGTGFDALLCLGNSLPHLLTPADLHAALTQFAGCLLPRGLLLIQNRNFDAVLAGHDRWMEPQSHREGEQEWLFLRFYDFEQDGTLTFNLVTLQREERGRWDQRTTATRLWPLRRDDVAEAMGVAGFSEIRFWGDMRGTPFDQDTSPNLVVTARRAN